LLRGLAFLEERSLIDWRAPGTAQRVQFLEARSRRLPVDDLAVRRSQRRAESRLADMLRYTRSVTCRRHFLLAYFGERSPERCGKCDICLGRHKAVVITPEDEPIMREILRQIQQDVPRAQWFDEATQSDRRIDSLVDWLVQEGFLQVEEPLEEVFSITEKATQMMEQWRPRKT
jgi:ATP-dependent DNA helicase RecQ